MEALLAEDKRVQLANAELVRVRQLVVNDNDSYVQCCDKEKELKESIKETYDDFEELVQSTHLAHRNACALRTLATQPRQQALAIVQKLRVDYERLREQQRKIAEAQAQKRAAAKAKAEAEELAKVCEQAGEDEMAAMVRADMQVPVISVPSDVPKVAGVRTRTVWHFSVAFPAKIPAAYKCPDEKKIQVIVNSQGKAAEKIIPGIKVWSEDVPWGAAKPK